MYTANMQELVEIQQLKKARSLLHPVRVLLLHYLVEPRTCRELAAVLNVTQQRLNHHLRELKKGRFIRTVKTRRKGNVLEAVYQRTGKAYWFSPKLAIPQRVKNPESRDQLALHQLLLMSESLQSDVAELLSQSGEKEIPNMGFEAEIVLRDEQERQAFTHDVLRSFHAVAEKYQGSGKDGTGYKIMVCCYPKL